MSYELNEALEDGMVCPKVGDWSVDKYRLVGLYCSLFSTGMKNKWDKRIYIDLYAGPGHLQIKNTGKIFQGSPLIALTVKDPFDKYIFCDDNPEKLSALEKRARRVAPEADMVFVGGDCNSKVDEILSAIPSYSSTNRVLSLCFVDPYNLAIRFDTLRRIADRYVDFLLLFMEMDANRNRALYSEEESEQLDDFLDSHNWREKWKREMLDGTKFPDFLAQEFSDRMSSIRYLPVPLHRMRRVKSQGKSLYRLALFSRSQTAHQFWDEVLKYSIDQSALF